MESCFDDFTEEANSLPNGVADALHEIAIDELGPPPRIPRKKLFDLKDDDPILEPARVLATARKWFIDTDFGRYNREAIEEVLRVLGILLNSRDAKPYPFKKGGE